MEQDKDTSQFPMRLQVFLAHSGLASRRKCEELIAAGRVSVNGAIIRQLGTKITAADRICVDGKPVSMEPRLVYVLLNKPKGYLCASSDSYGRPLAIDLLKQHYPERLYNVGRLDLYSSGALIFTNDGNFARAISHPSAEIEKEYFVETVFPYDDSVLENFVSGITVEGVFYKCKSAKKIGDKKMSIVLIEGKNREIRKVLSACGIKVRKLIRLRIGNISLGKLPLGSFRDISPQEISSLLSLCSNRRHLHR